MDIARSGYSISIDSRYILVIVLLALLYVLAIASGNYWRKKRWGKGLREELLPRPSSEKAHRAADDRRTKILLELGGSISDRKATEFIELPPGLSGELNFDANRSFDDFNERPNPYWWLARLRIQLSESHYLLTERVTDLVVALLRANLIEPREYPASIRVEKIQDKKHSDLFPWQVIIETYYPDNIAKWFRREEVRSWIGIGVQLFIPRDRVSASGDGGDGLLPSPTISAYGKCAVGTDGLNGTVGGVLDSSFGSTLGVTCWHVLSTGCQSRRWPDMLARATPHFDEKSPDVAMIDLNGPCFDVNLKNLQRVSVANAGQIDAAVKDCTKMRKSGGNSRLNGIINCGYVSNFVLGQSHYRGHHFLIQPDFRRRLGIAFPLTRRFSKPGDSGAWILDENFDRWFGMIVGGYSSPNNGTIAVSAAFIVEAYTEYINKMHGPTSFIFPEIYTN